MGFFSNLKSVKPSKKGRKAALKGDFEQAIKYFDEAFILSQDLKTLCENKAWIHLCTAIKLSKEGNIPEGKKEYQEFESVHQTYVDECNRTPGIGTRTRYHTWVESIKELVAQNRIYFAPLQEK
jgi:tetratricopeptide (TPR) repeat protein